MRLQCNKYALDAILDIYPILEAKVQSSPQFWGSSSLSKADREEGKIQELDKESEERRKRLKP